MEKKQSQQEKAYQAHLQRCLEVAQVYSHPQFKNLKQLFMDKIIDMHTKANSDSPEKAFALVNEVKGIKKVFDTVERMMKELEDYKDKRNAQMEEE